MHSNCNAYESLHVYVIHAELQEFIQNEIMKLCEADNLLAVGTSTHTR